MDPLTHALAGAVLADSLPGTEPKGRGVAFAMFMGAAPDLDLLPAFIARLPRNLVPGRILFDPYWIRLHRDLSHSLAFAVIVGIVAGWIFWRVGARAGAARHWCVLGMLCLLSHIALDLLNGGVGLWLPFSDQWTSWADLPVLDPLTLAIFVLCFFANRPVRLFWRKKGPEGEAGLEKMLRCLHEATGGRFGLRHIARAALLTVTAEIAVRAVWA